VFDLCCVRDSSKLPLVYYQVFLVKFLLVVKRVVRSLSFSRASLVMFFKWPSYRNTNLSSPPVLPQRVKEETHCRSALFLRRGLDGFFFPPSVALLLTSPLQKQTTPPCTGHHRALCTLSVWFPSPIPRLSFLFRTRERNKVPLPPTDDPPSEFSSSSSLRPARSF